MENSNLIKHFLQKLFGKQDGYSYLWMFPDKKTFSFPLDGDYSKAAEIAAESSMKGQNIFVGVNVSDRLFGLQERAKEENIVYQNALIVDIDVQSEWHKGEKYPPDFETARKFLPFEPSILVDSGGGLHAYYVFTKPLELRTPDDREKAKQWGKNLIELIRQNAGEYAGAVDSVFDLPRVLRLPGTKNFKGGNAPLCHVVQMTDKTFTLADFDGLEIPAPKKSSPARKSENPELDKAIALESLNYLDPAGLTYDEWLAACHSADSAGVDRPTLERWNGSGCQYKIDDVQDKLQTFKRNDFSVATLIYLARKNGFDDKKYRRDWYIKHDPDIPEPEKVKIIEWQDLRGRAVNRETLSEVKDAASYLDGLKEISAEIALNTKTSRSIALCRFYDFYSESASGFMARLKDAIKKSAPGTPLAGVSITAVNRLVKSEMEEIKKPPGIRTKDILPDCPIDLQFPDGSVVNENGISLVTDKKVFPLSKNLIVPLAVIDGVGGTYYRIAIYTGTKRKEITVPGGQFTGKDILLLNDFGALIIPENAKKAAAFFASVIVENDIPRLTMHSQTGWTSDNRFIYPPTGESWLMQPNLNFDFDKAFSPKGDKAEWLKMFERVKDCSPVARLILGAALSAPLIKPLEIRNLQLHVAGDSGRGKTAAVKFAMSIFGNPDLLKFTFNGTQNAMDTQAQMFSDLPTFLDELQATDKKIREQLDKMIYTFETGTNRVRNTRNNMFQPRKYFRGCRISTGEQRILSEHSGEGAIKRLLEIDADEIFPDKFAVEVHQFCRKNYGLFGKEWTDYIVSHKEEIEKDFAALENEFRGLYEGLYSEHYRSFAAFYAGYLHFGLMLGYDRKDFAGDSGDFVHFAFNLPLKNQSSNADRAFSELQSFVAGHEKFFVTESITESKKTVDDLAVAYETYGKIFNDGSVCFLPPALKKILQDNLNFPSGMSIIRQFAEKGIIEFGKDNDGKNKYQRQIRINGKQTWVYRVKGLIENAPPNDNTADV